MTIRGDADKRSSKTKDSHMSTGKILGIPFTAVLMLAAVAFATPSLAQNATTPGAENPPAAGAPAAPGAPAAGAPGAINPDTGLPADQTAAPANEAAPAGAIEESKPEEPAENPYGLSHMFNLKNPDPVTFGVGIILAVMMLGSWIIFISKYLSTGGLISQARSATRGGTPRGAFASLAEDAQAAAAQHSQLGGQVALADWVGSALNRSIDNISSQLRGGNAFLATVASSAPFVGLFGTVYGILKALLSIGIAGQPSIDKVAGPVGEALIMTAIGLAAAVPAVIFYNVVVGRNRTVTDALRNYASDLQAQALGASAGGSGRRR